MAREEFKCKAEIPYRLSPPGKSQWLARSWMSQPSLSAAATWKSICAGRSSDHFKCVILQVIKLRPTKAVQSQKPNQSLGLRFISTAPTSPLLECPLAIRVTKCLDQRRATFTNYSPFQSALTHFLVLTQAGKRMWDVALFLTAARGRQYPVLGPLFQSTG